MRLVSSTSDRPGSRCDHVGGNGTACDILALLGGGVVWPAKYTVALHIHKSLRGRRQCS